MNLGAQRYAVYGPENDDPLIIDAENWVFALGTALELLEREDWVSRLSCEVHPDGTVVAEDRVTASRYLIHRVPYTVPESVLAKHRFGGSVATPAPDGTANCTDGADLPDAVEIEPASKDTPEVL